jgi:hypothetical protein
MTDANRLTDRFLMEAAFRNRCECGFESVDTAHSPDIERQGLVARNSPPGKIELPAAMACQGTGSDGNYFQPQR